MTMTFNKQNDSMLKNDKKSNWAQTTTSIKQHHS